MNSTITALKTKLYVAKYVALPPSSLLFDLFIAIIRSENALSTQI